MNLLSKIFVTLGMLLLVFGVYLVYQRFSPQKLQFMDLQAQEIEYKKIIPVRITISSLNIENSIYPSSVKEGKWEASDKGVSYLSASPIPGEKGNSIMYGHNWDNILGRLTQIKPGAKISILLSTGETRNFVVEFTQEVSPKDTHILNNTKDKRITLYTCSGFLDSKRFVVTAVLAN